jgi:hypothetical protein
VSADTQFEWWTPFRVPEHLRRRTIEEAFEVLLTSYSEAYRKITAQGQELGEAQRLIPHGFQRSTLPASIEGMAEALYQALAKVAELSAENKALAERKYDLEDINNQAAFLALLATQGEA